MPDSHAFAYAARYGIAPAQFKAFMDATGQLWQSGALVGKPITFVTSTASLGGGQEVTILSSKPLLVLFPVFAASFNLSPGLCIANLDSSQGCQLLSMKSTTAMNAVTSLLGFVTLHKMYALHRCALQACHSWQLMA